MKLTNDERRSRLAECETSADFHNLYEIVFKEEVPEQFKRDPNEILDDIINAIYDNKKIIGVDLPDNIKI